MIRRTGLLVLEALLVVVIAVALLAAFACVLPSVEADGLGLATATATGVSPLDTEWEVIGIAQRNTTTGAIRIVPLAGLVAAATPYQATATPTVSATVTYNTQAPTIAPSATLFPSHTPEVTLTPTQETGLPDCVGAVLKDRLNVRDGPGLQTRVIGLLTGKADGFNVELVYPVGLWVDPVDGYKWVRFEGTDRQPTLAGWAAYSYQPNANGFPETWIQLSPACEHLPYENVQACIGWHTTIPEIDRTDLARSLDILRAKGYCVAVKAVDNDTWQMAVNRGGIGVFRTVRAGDCADVTQPPKTAALLRLLGQGPYLPPADQVTYVEPDNECGSYFTDAAWMDAYLAELIRLYSERGYRVIFGTMGPGHWSEDQVKALDATWETALDYGACLGYHAYAVKSGVRVVDSGPWLGFRHVMIREWLLELDARYAAIPFCATEVGSGFGYDPFDESDFVDYNGIMQTSGELRFTAWWTAGRWTADNGRSSTNGKMEGAAKMLPIAQ